MLPALEAVLAEKDVRAAHTVVVAGDVVSGPQPREVFARLKAMGDRVVWVRGNADREAVAMARGTFTGVAPDAVSPWAAGELTAAQVEWLDKLPTTVTFGDVLVCHATPRDDEEVVLVDSPIARWLDVLGGVPDSIRTVVCGHTHMPFVRQVDRRTVVNAGSVGMPYGAPGPSWALVTPEGVQLRRSALDRESAAHQIVQTSSYPAGSSGWMSTC
ncbi:metallophosphoesterase family protein [Kribbella albertanoniae]